MMIFKDAGETQDTATPGQGSSPSDESQKSLSLLGGVARPEGMESADGFDASDVDGPAGKFSALNRGTMLLLVVIVLAVGTLYLMRMGQDKLTGSGLAKEVEDKIELALAKLVSSGPGGADAANQQMEALFNDTEPLIQAFRQDAARQQVPVEFIKQNPFAIERVKKIDPVVKTNDSELEAQRQRERRLKELATEFGKLSLTSVVLGARPIAIIDNELYQPGSKIGSFTVKSVEELSVVLTADGDQYILKLDRDATGPSKGRR